MTYTPRDKPRWNERHFKGTVTAEDVLAICPNGARIQGEAGTGKSKLFKAIAITLEDRGFKVLTLAPTNLAALNIDGQTIHRALNIKGINTGHLVTTLSHQKPDYILIDEDSQISSEIWNIIYLWKKSGVKVFIFGDGDIKDVNGVMIHYGQTQPVEEDENKLHDDYLNSDIVKTICEYSLIHLETNFRYVDDQTNNMKEIVSSVQKGENIFPEKMMVSTKDLEKFRLNICYTNKMRQYVDAILMKADEVRTVRNGFKSPRIKGDKKTQESYFTKRSPLICREAIRKDNIIKGTKWVVKSWDAANVEWSQGQTITEDFIVHEKDKMDIRLLYTAVSRASHSKYLHFSDVKIPSVLDDPILKENLLRQVFVE
ncbi:hypothetical protein HDV00_010612 [Rhizophlyctis rosea]|nr:hypothetical protein HDV00_010612 [Rhizophlyctis rosea]